MKFGGKIGAVVTTVLRKLSVSSRFIHFNQGLILFVIFFLFSLLATALTCRVETYAK